MEPIEIIKNAFSQNRLSHAYLVSGLPGSGKTAFVKSAAAYLLCENKKQNKPCEMCKQCLLMQANNHPDFIAVIPEEKSHSIKINQIRDVTEKLSRTAHGSGYQVVMIAPADAMPVQAANALLKTLEEPNGKVILFLVDDQKSILPATIRSRCQQLHFSSKKNESVWMQQHQALREEIDSHMKKIALRQIDAIAFPMSWLKIPLSDIVDQMMVIVHRIAQSQSTSDEKSVLLHQFMQTLLEKKSFISKSINLNQQLCLESLMIEWERYVH